MRTPVEYLTQSWGAAWYPKEVQCELRSQRGIAGEHSGQRGQKLQRPSAGWTPGHSGKAMWLAGRELRSWLIDYSTGDTAPSVFLPPK